MKIGVDAGSLAVTDKRLKLGVYQMSYNLLKTLGEIDPKNDYFLYSFRPIEKKIMRQFGPRMKNIIALPRKGWNYWALPRQLRVDRPKIFLGLSQALPHFISPPAVVVVHDLGFEHFPQYYQDSERLKKITRYATSKAKKIVAVSNFTKKDLLKFYAVPEEKIQVIYEASDPIFKPQGDRRIQEIKTKYRLKNPYFLFVGALKKSKNLPRLLVAFALFLKDTQKKFTLVLAGSDRWLDPLIDVAIENLQLAEKVIKLSYVPGLDLAGLYSGAEAFVSPSFYEGFGLTFLEAMACGCPVIGGNNSAMKEVMGKAGILVNPQKEEEIAKAMIKLSEDKKFRGSLVKRGFNQAKKFSWSLAAKKMLKVLRDCI